MKSMKVYLGNMKAQVFAQVTDEDETALYKITLPSVRIHGQQGDFLP